MLMHSTRPVYRCGTSKPHTFSLQISFSSSELGGFNEEFQWFIEGSPQPLRLKIQGEVIGPTFQFDTSQINFGTVPYGE